MQLSAEIRWFGKGPIDPAMKSWFMSRTSHGFAPGGGKLRTDVYLHDPAQTELGIKVRGGQKGGVEVKGLVRAAASRVSAAPFAGGIELWCKWPSGLLKLPATKRIVVDKCRWVRKFDTAGARPLQVRLGANEEPVSGTRPRRGCSVELTAISVNGARWWSLGFESFGAPSTVARDLKSVAALMSRRRPPPLTGAVATSYPGWLAGF